MQEQSKIQDRLNHILGNYVGFAVNDCKHYPKRPYLEQEEHSQGFSSDEMLDAYIVASYELQKGKNGRKD